MTFPNVFCLGDWSDPSTDKNNIPSMIVASVVEASEAHKTTGEVQKCGQELERTKKKKDSEKNSCSQAWILEISTSIRNIKPDHIERNLNKNQRMR